MAAGLGFKTFATGEVLTASDVNGYLMQGVLVFADAAARTAAITSPEEGQVSFLKDTNSTEYYDGSAWVAIGGGSSSVNKNYLINGGFAVAQRGTSFTSTSGANNDDAYTLDRWYILSDGNDVIDVTQDTTTVPTNGEFAIALDVETTNKKFGIATIIENKDVIGLVGNTVTFSFKAKVSATTKLDNVKAAIVAWSGTADTVTSDIISAWGGEGSNPTLIANATYENTPANLNLTTSYATYSVTAPVDTASTQNLILFIWSDVTDTTAGDFLYIAESKLELGLTATAFQYAGGTFQGELADCQRYYWNLVTGNDLMFGTGSYYNGAFAQGFIPFPVTMRVAPTLIVASGANYYYLQQNGGVDALDDFTINRPQVNGTAIFNTTQGAGTGGYAGIFFTNNASAYIAFSSEL
jgi:hypothetical protein